MASAGSNRNTHFCRIFWGDNVVTTHIAVVLGGIVFSSVSGCLCLFVNMITLELFEILS